MGLASVEAHTQEVELDGIIVYGAKNAQTLDDVSASVAVVTSEEIHDRQLTSFREVFRTLSNVSDSDFVDAGFIIRGINSEGLTPGGSPLASFYIDGIQQTVNGTRRGARGLWDVEQVEVYRGPQSTLTGRAALAGAIYVKTKDPSFEAEQAIQGTLGTLGTRHIATMINIPIISNQLAVRFSAEYAISENDINYPSYESFGLFDEFVEDEYYQLRGKVLFKPDALPNTLAILTYSFAGDSPHLDDIGGPALGFKYSDRRGDFNLPLFTESRSAKNHNAGLEITHDITPSLRFTSLTAYTRNVTDRPSINLGSPGETRVLIGDQNEELATQELRLNYNQGLLKAVAGVYMARDDNKADFIRPDFFGFAHDKSSNSDKNKNLSGFGELTYEFIPSWKIVAGGRADYTESEVSASFVRTFFAGGEQVTGFEGSFEELVYLPKVGLIKDLAPGHRLSFIAQRGFRNGGAGAQRTSGEVYTFDPEFAWNYELSYKGRLLDDKLTLNANLFYMDWKNQQVEILQDPLDFGSTIISNAASSVSKGFELEARYQVTAILSTFASLGYTDTEFKEFETVTLGNLSGKPFPEASLWNIAFGAKLKNDKGYYAGFDAKYTDEFLARFGQAPQEFVDGYFVANTQIGYDDEHFGANLFVENIFDKDYFTYADNDIAATLGARRMIGVRVTAKY